MYRLVPSPQAAALVPHGLRIVVKPSSRNRKLEWNHTLGPAGFLRRSFQVTSKPNVRSPPHPCGSTRPPPLHRPLPCVCRLDPGQSAAQEPEGHLAEGGLRVLLDVEEQRRRQRRRRPHTEGSRSNHRHGATSGSEHGRKAKSAMRVSNRKSKRCLNFCREVQAGEWIACRRGRGSRPHFSTGCLRAHAGVKCGASASWTKAPTCVCRLSRTNDGTPPRSLRQLHPTTSRQSRPGARRVRTCHGPRATGRRLGREYVLSTRVPAAGQATLRVKKVQGRGHARATSHAALPSRTMTLFTVLSTADPHAYPQGELAACGWMQARKVPVPVRPGVASAAARSQLRGFIVPTQKRRRGVSRRFNR